MIDLLVYLFLLFLLLQLVVRLFIDSMKFGIKKLEMLRIVKKIIIYSFIGSSAYSINS